MAPEMPRNVFLKHILYSASLSSLSSLLFSEFSDTMPQIEEEIKNNTDENKSDGEMEIDDKTGGITGYKQSRNRRYYRMRRKLQTIVDVLYSVEWRLDHFFYAWI
jgi:hypothetical protein